MTPGKVKKRLFLFAAYDDTDTLRQTTMHYIRELKRLGDIILFKDKDGIPGIEISSLCLHSEFSSHGEYDFGSYKRGYVWAIQNINLSDYDWLYLVNDSVIGPVRDLQPVVEDLESRGSDAIGMVYNPHVTKFHLQTWFVGLAPQVFLNPSFKKFMEGVKKEKSKYSVCRQYEHGLTRLLISEDFKFDYLMVVKGKDIYNRPKRLYKRGLPFFKRDSIYRHNGSLGHEIKYLMNRSSPELQEAIKSDLIAENKEKIVTANRLVTTLRFLKYLCKKYINRV